MPDQKTATELLKQDNPEKRGTSASGVSATALLAVFETCRQNSNNHAGLSGTFPFGPGKRTTAQLPLARSTNLVGHSLPSRVTLKRQTDEEVAAYAYALLMSLAAAPIEAFARTTEGAKPASRKEIETMFPVYTDEQLVKGRAAVETDLRLHRAYDRQGRISSVWEKLLAAGLSRDELTTVLNAAAYVRENFARHRGPDGLIDGDQKSNWLHTMDELDEILESCHGASGRQIMQSTMAIFGDSVKTKRNFTVHNLDGSEAWQIVAERLRLFLSDNDVAAIKEANKEHQIGPPEFMARIYTSSIIGSLNAERGRILAALSAKTFGEMNSMERSQLLFIAGLKQAYDIRAEEIAAFHSLSELSEEEHARLEKLVARQNEGAFVSDEESQAISRLYHKIANPFGVGLCDTPNGGKAVVFEGKELELFARTGNLYWHVPHESTSWYKQSRIGIDADSKANYARVGGFRKLLHLNGPESDTYFQFCTLDSCLQSPRRSYAQAWEIMTPEGRVQATARLCETDAAIARAKTATEDWLRHELKVDDDEPMPDIPFWNVELVYPDRGEFEHEWWRINKIPALERSNEEQKFWQNHRFDGLSEQQRAHYLRAIRIRDYMVDQLAREQRVDASIPIDFLPVMED